MSEEDQIADLEDQISDLNNTIEGLEANLEEKGAEIDELTDTARDRTTEILELKERLDNIRYMADY